MLGLSCPHAWLHSLHPDQSRIKLSGDNFPLILGGRGSVCYHPGRSGTTFFDPWQLEMSFWIIPDNWMNLFSSWAVGDEIRFIRSILVSQRRGVCFSRTLEHDMFLVLGGRE